MINNNAHTGQAESPRLAVVNGLGYTHGSSRIEFISIYAQIRLKINRRERKLMWRCSSSAAGQRSNSDYLLPINCATVCTLEAKEIKVVLLFENQLSSARQMIEILTTDR